MKNVTMYMGPKCNFCDAAKRLLNRNNIPFNEINIDDLSDFHNDSDLKKRLIHLVNENKRVKKMKNATNILFSLTTLPEKK